MIIDVIAVEAQDDFWQSKVESEVLNSLTITDNTDLLIRFSVHPDLSQATSMDWSARGWFVYRSLLDTASQSQRSAIAYLESRGMHYQSFFAEMIYMCGMLIMKLHTLRFPEVSKIYFPGSYSIINAFISPTLTSSYQTPIDLISSHLQYMVNEKTGSNPEDYSWAVSDVKADQFWSTFNLQGEGIVVANIDTGVQWDHPALINSYKCLENPGNPACWWDPADACEGVPCDDRSGVALR
jgi:hypothetical protein